VEASQFGRRGPFNLFLILLSLLGLAYYLIWFRGLRFSSRPCFVAQGGRSHRHWRSRLGQYKSFPKKRLSYCARVLTGGSMGGLYMSLHGFPMPGNLHAIPRPSAGLIEWNPSSSLVLALTADLLPQRSWAHTRQPRATNRSWMTRQGRCWPGAIFVEIKGQAWEKAAVR
jgi:hypothetical protein